MSQGTFWRNEERWSNSPGRSVLSGQAAELYRSEYVEVELADAVARTRSQPDNQTRLTAPTKAVNPTLHMQGSLHFRVYCKSSVSGNGILRWCEND